MPEQNERSLLPRKEKVVVKHMALFAAAHFDQKVNSKEELVAGLKPGVDGPHHSAIRKLSQFHLIAPELADRQWALVLEAVNVIVADKPRRAAVRLARAERRETSRLQEEAKTGERNARLLENLRSRIEQDEVLSRESVTIAEASRKYGTCLVKVYLPFGGTILEGSPGQIVAKIKQLVLSSAVKVRAHCPACTGMNLRFAGQHCLCNNCGALSLLDQNLIVRRYAPEDKPAWWAMALRDIGTGLAGTSGAEPDWVGGSDNRKQGDG